MSKSLAEVFKIENKVVKIPKHMGQNYVLNNVASNAIDKIKDSPVRDVIKKATGIDIKKLPSGKDILKSIENVRKNPVQALWNIANDVLNPKEEKNKDAQEKVVEKVDKKAVEIPVNHNEGRPTGGEVNGRDRPDYGKILGGVNGKVNDQDADTSKLISGIINGVSDKKEKEKGVEGNPDKKEFEKGRTPFSLPKSNEGDKIMKIYESLGSSDVGKKNIGNLADYAKDNVSRTSSIGSKGVLDRTAPVDKKSKQWKRVASDYFAYNDPYSSSSVVHEFSTFNEAVQDLRSRGLLSSYRDIAGFEMGSDHMWKIRILPYPYEEDDVEVFKSLGRTSVVPPLPVYRLPNYWKETDKTSSGGTVQERLTSEASGILGSDGKAKKLSINIPSLLDGVPLINDIKDNGLISGINNAASSEGKSGEIKNGKIFSFSHNPPVLSYDITLGTIRADSLRLFNGSSSEVMAGMSYNAMMSMSILDDVYGSMKKYMASFINAAYDINTNSMAPYYSIAFQIELIILRAGGQINYHHKFIGVPIEYTVRHSGSQETTEESRVDLNFGIIGYKTPSSGKKREVYTGNMGGRAVAKTKNGLEKAFSLSNLRWGDIQVKMGQDGSSMGRASVTGKDGKTEIIDL